jgi:hypothetical protein
MCFCVIIIFMTEFVPPQPPTFTDNHAHLARVAFEVELTAGGAEPVNSYLQKRGEFITTPSITPDQFNALHGQGELEQKFLATPLGQIVAQNKENLYTVGEEIHRSRFSVTAMRAEARRQAAEPSSAPAWPRDNQAAPPQQDSARATSQMARMGQLFGPPRPRPH